MTNCIYRYACPFCKHIRQIGTKKEFDDVPHDFCARCGIPVVVEKTQPSD